MEAGQEKIEERYRRAERARNAYLLSLFSLLFCVLMLTGITYAWMTDTASSTNNRIIAGNLDLDVQYMEGNCGTDGQITVITVADDEEWHPIGELFSSENTASEAWTPGQVKAVALKVTNNSSLAAQYDVFLHISEELGGVTTEDKEYVISEWLGFAMTEPFDLSFSTDSANLTEEKAQLFPARADGKQKDLTDFWSRINSGEPATGELWKKPGTSFINEGKARSISGKLLPGETQYINLLLYLPLDAAKTAAQGSAVPYIKMGLYVVGAQAGEETDSFGTGYDNFKQEVKVATDSVAQKADENASAYSYAQGVDQEQTYTQTYMPQYATVNLVSLTSQEEEALKTSQEEEALNSPEDGKVPGFVSSGGGSDRVDVSVFKADIQYQKKDGAYVGVPGLIFYQNTVLAEEKNAEGLADNTLEELVGKPTQQEAEASDCYRFSMQYQQEELRDGCSVLCYCFNVTGMQEGVPKTLRFYIGKDRKITGISCEDAAGSQEDLSQSYSYSKETGILQFTTYGDGMNTLTILLKKQTL